MKAALWGGFPFHGKMTDQIVLDNRLRLIASMAAGNGHLADVGTDHGYIPV